MRWLIVLAPVVVLGGLALADEPHVKFLTPADGTTLIRRTESVIVQVDSGTKASEVTVRVKRERDAKSTTHTLEPIAGRPGSFEGKVATPIGTLELTARVKTAEGSVETAAINVEVNQSITCSEILGPGTPIPVVKANAVSGEEVTVVPRKGVAIVHFYSAWDDCEPEVRWLEGFAKKYGKKGLTIVGVGSLVAKDHEAWKQYLEKLGVTWKNVPDPEGAIAQHCKGCSHDVVGSQAYGCITYVMKDGKIAGGDYMNYQYVAEAKDTSTEQALAALFGR